MSVEQLPESWRGRRIHLLEALLHVRHYVRERHALWFMTGFETVDSLFPFIQGWLANTQLNGGSERAWQEFLTWYRGTRGQPLRADWYVRPLQECQGDDERTALVLLDLVAEYADRFGVSPRGTLFAMEEPVVPRHGEMPRGQRDHPVELVDVLLWLRRSLRAGGDLASITGAPTMDSLFCFTCGWLRNTVYNQARDVTAEPFQNWLRESNRELRLVGWHTYCLRASGGDHARAIRMFLDLVAEFSASH